jgi:cysteine desulfurase
MKKLQTLLIKTVLNEIPEVTLNGHSELRLPNNTHFTFLGVNGEDLIIKLDEYGIAASTGSACSVNTQKASHVLESMGFSLEQITGSLRLTVGIFNTENEIKETVDILKKVVEELRAVSPFKEKYSFVSKN